jgi:DNA-binding SARP family transcriptional activator
LVQQEKISQAHEFLDSASQLAVASGSHFDLGFWHLVAGRLNLLENNPQQAVKMLSEAGRQFNEGGHKVEAARSNLFLALGFFYLDDRRQCLASLRESFSQAEELESDHVLVVAALETSPVLRFAMKDGILSKQASQLLDRTRTFENRIPFLRRTLRSRTNAVPFSPPKINIQALGIAQVELDGKPVQAPEWQNQKKARELFYYLLANPSGLSKEAIGSIIWPESSAAQLKLQFKNALYRLRYALGQEVISFDGDRYWFNRELDYAYDVEFFLSEIARSHASRRIDEKIMAYRSAMQHYSGVYLPEVGSTWVVPIRENLAEKYIQVLLNLAQLYLEKGDSRATLEVSHQILFEDSTLEEAHRLAMLAYAAKGDRAGLTRQYESCRQNLLEEYKSEPSPQTVQLYQLLRG